MEQGLPDSYVQAVLQTRDGYLWLGTQNAGLVRFDGVKFTPHRPGFGLADDASIRALCESRDGTLWVGTDGAGLWALKDGSFTRWTRKDGLRTDHIRALHEDSDGSLLIAFSVNGVMRMQRASNDQLTFIDAGAGGSSIAAFAVDAEGCLWAVGDGLWQAEQGRFVRSRTPDLSGNFSALAISPNNDFWIGGQNGLIELRPTGEIFRHTEEHGLSDSRVRALKFDADGNLWVGSNNGIDRLTSGTFLRCLTREQIPYDLVYAFHEDQEGCLWIGSNGGLARLKDDKFTLLTTSEGLAQNIVVGAVQAPDGSFWIGTWTKGVTHVHGTTITHYNHFNGLPNDEVRSMHRASNGAVWVGTTGGGLTRFAEGKVANYTPFGASRSVVAIQEDHTGALLLLSEAGGLLRLKDESFQPLSAPAPSGETLHTLHATPRSNLWVATGNSVLRESAGLWHRWALPESAQGKAIRSIYEARNGDLWVCAQNSGLLRLRHGVFKTYSLEHGLALDNFYSVIEDENDDLWVASKRGLFFFTSQDLADFDAGLARSLRPIDYTQLSGLRNPRFIRYGFPLVSRLSDGRICYPTTKGVAIVDPVRLPRNQVPPPVHIVKVRLDREELDFANELAIPPGTRDV
ncbi:MAG TPA: two-component regulator propeller domain-containing protein, partial [Methylomirabilota bacterium]|nr:two-component regulator propeller domain-containing protein [Methylomirabilota bacterium]